MSEEAYFKIGPRTIRHDKTHNHWFVYAPIGALEATFTSESEATWHAKMQNAWEINAIARKNEISPKIAIIFHECSGKEDDE